MVDPVYARRDLAILAAREAGATQREIAAARHTSRGQVAATLDALSHPGVLERRKKLAGAGEVPHAGRVGR